MCLNDNKNIIAELFYISNWNRFLHKKQDIVPNQQTSSSSTGVENHNGLDNYAFVPDTDKIIQLSQHTKGKLLNECHKIMKNSWFSNF